MNSLWDTPGLLNLTTYDFVSPGQDREHLFVAKWKMIWTNLVWRTKVIHCIIYQYLAGIMSIITDLARIILRSICQCIYSDQTVTFYVKAYSCIDQMDLIKIHLLWCNRTFCFKSTLDWFWKKLLPPNPVHAEVNWWYGNKSNEFHTNGKSNLYIFICNTVEFEQWEKCVTVTYAYMRN